MVPLRCFPLSSLSTTSETPEMPPNYRLTNRPTRPALRFFTISQLRPPPRPNHEIAIHAFRSDTRHERISDVRDHCRFGQALSSNFSLSPMPSLITDPTTSLILGHFMIGDSTLTRARARTPMLESQQTRQKRRWPGGGRGTTTHQDRRRAGTARSPPASGW